MSRLTSLRSRLTLLHVTLLSVCTVSLSFSGYLGTRHYLDAEAHRFLSGQCHAIGEKLLTKVSQRGEAVVISEINEHYAPEVIEEFIRITRQNGSVLYQSPPPQDRKFDPASIPAIHGILRHEVFKKIRSGSTELVLNALPFWTGQGKYYLVEVGSSYRTTNSVLHPLSVQLAIATILIIICAIVVGYWFTGRALIPVKRLTEQAETISHLTIGDRLPVTASGDEIERLGIALNKMIGRLDEAFKQTDQFSADVSHELRTPLTILQAELEHMSQQAVPPDVHEAIGSALEETERLTRIIDHLLELSRIDRGDSCTQRDMVDLGALTIATAGQMNLLAEEKTILLVYSITPGVTVEGDPVRLRQVIANLLDNAIKYTPEGGTVKLHVELAGEDAILEIADNGVGIPASSVPYIFDRFYRADWARSRDSGGVGLGLSVVKAICTAHKAEIKAITTEGEGACFRVRFPAVQPSIVPPRKVVRKSGDDKRTYEFIT